MPTIFDGHGVNVVLCPVRNGHVHYHHSLTWHGSHVNTSGSPRRAIGIHYMTDETQYHANGDHIIKPLVTVSDGEKLANEAFPIVMEGGRCVGPQIFSNTAWHIHRSILMSISVTQMCFRVCKGRNEMLKYREGPWL